MQLKKKVGNVNFNRVPEGILFWRFCIQLLLQSDAFNCFRETYNIQKYGITFSLKDSFKMCSILMGNTSQGILRYIRKVMYSLF